MKNMLIKAVRTFVQAFLGCVAAGIANLGGETGTELWQEAAAAILASAVAAGLAAVMNLPKKGGQK